MIPDSFPSSQYSRYKQSGFNSRWLRPSNWQQFIKDMCPSEERFSYHPIGESCEQREIGCWRWGRGEVPVLIWSQMHGNETTGTMALADLFTFFNATDDDFEELRTFLFDKISLYIVPILNPDGAEVFQRVNARGVDINRDARKQATPEMQAFMKLKEEINPQYAINLHDQRNIFSAGHTANPATMSFLAASADASRKLTPAREKAMNLIAMMHDSISKQIPGSIGRYSDEFYPRAIGDYFHSQGIPCVLIESGAAFNDALRDTARKMNFLVMLEAFRVIAGSMAAQNYREQYFAIPENRELFYDIILRNARFVHDEQAPPLDLAILIDQDIDKVNAQLTNKYIIKEIGDLSYNYALMEYTKLRLQVKVWPKPGEVADMKVYQDNQLIYEFKEGYLHEKH